MFPLIALATAVLQEIQIPAELMRFATLFFELWAVAMLVIPVSNIRKLFGGLPNIPLPGLDSVGNQNVITAGRWVSWVVTIAILGFAHLGGVLSAPDFANFYAWFTMEVAIAAGLANIIYTNWWKAHIEISAIG